ncbi:MAG: RNase adaptor protein RapZ [Candidatus Dactylopiibacterium carminicum]|uniref:RNase adapter RapZ n=1 Tax=Candidatus Dactylopiibacterium carminicum TaxID=857335 RepID=A0A272EXE3_9RHOO|nr:RNase adapter RapZ [Candidatus Dactylopiibacterium carminicum]KAF7599496.1 RNase adapter RapZ [Candidatus Dactylopiibacterium carminicum]PAS94310.1 MAG: RNase adaptor protein RapZ [Candidatus Dactylopiibacterium carminicum]PAS98504.1 MAG: RNase adaptor protein RapZ [Candidatus Dactylopiibacterium carminicum]PAS99503.1 MAG: RNase adaptor protein RapZ [Candidatus Dactylopiibacterium carminicum]
MQLTLISGLSGSGKSIALKVLEDAGYYCVDNLPSTLLEPLIVQLAAEGYARVGVAMDVRSGVSIAGLPERVAAARTQVDDLRFIFLDSRDEALIARFSETRRRHPLAEDGVTLEEAIRRERELLSRVAELGQRIDTSALHPNVLRSWVRELIQIPSGAGTTLLFQSFGFKHGLPVDADFVFDVRCLPNPFYDPALRLLTGQDQPVADFLAASEEVQHMQADIQGFVARWLPVFRRDGRSHLTVAIGCTGGQHRSVYLAERLAQAFAGEARVMLRHRALAAGQQR